MIRIYLQKIIISFTFGVTLYSYMYYISNLYRTGNNKSDQANNNYC